MNQPLTLATILLTNKICFSYSCRRLSSNHVCQINFNSDLFLFFVFVALRPKSTAMVIAGRSVHLSTLFPGQA